MAQRNPPMKQKQTQTNLFMKQTTHSTLVVAKVGQGGGGLDWEFGISRSKPLYTEWVDNTVLVYSTGNTCSIFYNKL